MRVLPLLVAACLALPAGAQTARAQALGDSVAADTALVLPGVRVEAARGAGGVAGAPFAVAVAFRGPEERAVDPSTSLARSLQGLPGVRIVDRHNPSLGERVAVRGQGARAAFGVRGVQVVLDGIPLTLADGQAVLTPVDPAWVRRAEVVRGPAGALWGNGSGGVLFLSTIPEAAEPRVRARVAGGAYGLYRADAKASGTTGGTLAGLAVSHTRLGGYRGHSDFVATRARAFARTRLGPEATLAVIAAGDLSPTQQHAGALTLEQLDADRRQAEARFVATASGKDSAQGQVGLRLDAPLGGVQLQATAYGLGRRLRNPLPFAYISVDRAAGGLRASLQGTAGPVTWTAGADGALQRDSRANFTNTDGQPTGDARLDQLETVTSAALWGRLRLAAEALVPGLSLEGTLRADRVRFSADDRRLDDGDQTGSRTLGAFSPSLGASLRRGPVLVFASVSTAFETPTTTELANRPDGAGGFNPDLEPQRTLGVEAGARGVLGPVLFDLAVYRLWVRDGLTPFEGPTGRTFFRNQARAGHTGLEAAATWRALPSLQLSGTAAVGRYRYGAGALDPEGTDVDGRRIPGLPAWSGSLEARWTAGALTVTPSLEAAGGVWADDANTVRVPGYAVLDLAASYAWETPSGTLRPFLRVSNVTGARYVASVVANARGGRYYEPAPERGVVAGLQVSL